jgi:arginase family enzyme
MATVRWPDPTTWRWWGGGMSTSRGMGTRPSTHPRFSTCLMLPWGTPATAEARADLDGFWIHLDADVLDAAVMPAVDSPEPGGPDLDQLAGLLRPLVNHPKALGMELTIYDPKLDPDLTCGTRLVGLLEGLLSPK